MCLFQVENAENCAKTRAQSAISLYSSFPSYQAILEYREKLSKEAMHDAAVARLDLVHDRITSDPRLLDAALERFGRGEAIFQGLNLPSSLSEFFSNAYETLHSNNVQSPFGNNTLGILTPFYSSPVQLENTSTNPRTTRSSTSRDRQIGSPPTSTSTRARPQDISSREVYFNLGNSSDSNLSNSDLSNSIHEDPSAIDDLNADDPNELGLSEEELYLARLAQENFDFASLE